MKESALLWNGMTMRLDDFWPRLLVKRGSACPVVLEAEGLEGSGSPCMVVTGRRMRENGGYGMDKGTVARDMGWIPREDMLVELCAERFARRCGNGE